MSIANRVAFIHGKKSMRQDTTTGEQPQPAPPAPIVRRHVRKESRIFRKTTMRRAIIEAIGIFLAGRLLAMVPITFWPAAIYPLILVLRLALAFSPPVWAALRVVSTKREKMSLRFWKLGWQLALCCTVADAVIALALGEPYLFGGPATGPDLLRFGAHGAAALSPLNFLVGEVVTFVLLAIYYTIAVVCTRLANGGFLRFTMPTGDGRVTL